MTIKNLFSLCGNITKSTIFEIYKNGKRVSCTTFTKTAAKFCEAEIKQFDINVNKNVVVVYF